MVNRFTTAACDDAPLTRLAMFSPLSPVQTAIADYTEGLLPHLARHFDITVIIAGNYNPTHPMFRPGAQPVIRYMTYRDFQRCARL